MTGVLRRYRVAGETCSVKGDTAADGDNGLVPPGQDTSVLGKTTCLS